MNISLYVTPIKTPLSCWISSHSLNSQVFFWEVWETPGSGWASQAVWWFDYIMILLWWYHHRLVSQLYHDFFSHDDITIQLVMMYEGCPPSALSWPLQDILRERMTGERGWQQIGGRRGRSGRRVSGNIILSLSDLWWQGFFSSCP